MFSKHTKYLLQYLTVLYNMSTQNSSAYKKARNAQSGDEAIIRAKLGQNTDDESIREFKIIVVNMLKVLMEMGVREKVFSGVSIKPYSQASTVGVCPGVGCLHNVPVPSSRGRACFPCLLPPAAGVYPATALLPRLLKMAVFVTQGRQESRSVPSFLDDLHCLPLVAAQFFQCLQGKLFHSVREIGEMGLGGFWQWLFSSCQHHGETFLDSLCEPSGIPGGQASKRVGTPHG